MSRRLWCLGLSALLAAVAGCGGERGGARDAGLPARESVLVTDRTSGLRAQLEAADREFARQVGARGLDAWVEAFAEDGAVLPAEGPIATGHETIRDLFAPMFADPDFEISWEPEGLEVSSSGDLGYTFGRWEASARKSGVIERSTGKYVTVWRRGADGRWRVFLDIGNREAGTRGGSSR